jgi:hypothetical protein
MFRASTQAVELSERVSSWDNGRRETLRSFLVGEIGGAFVMKYLTRSLLGLCATVVVLLAITAGPSSAGGVTPDQLMQAGWTCIQPQADPTRRICAPPGLGLPPLPGTPGFADRAPSYEFLIFNFATGEFIGTQHLLRPDIYLHGTPPCPQQPGGEYVHILRNDLWACFRPK